MKKKTRLFLLLSIQVGVLITLYGCNPSPTTLATPISEDIQNFSTSPDVTIQGSTSGKEEVQTIIIDNCDGKSDAIRTEQRTQSVDVTISGEIAAKVGASAEVISAEVQVAVGAATHQGGSRSMSIQLAAPPKTYMQFQLVWTGDEQVGIVQNLRGSNIPIAFRGFIPTDVRIKSQSDIGCPGTDTLQEVVQPEPTATSQSTSPIQPLTAGQLLYEETFENTSGWVLEGNKIEDNNLIIVPENDAVPHNSGTYTDFVFESRFFVPASGSMAFYLRHQQPPCADWNCSIQLALYYGYENTLAARQFLGADSGKQEDIKKSNIASIIHPNDWNTISVVVKGSQYDVTLNNVFVFSFTDNTYASGAFIIDNAGASNVKIDYVRIFDIH
jgi:hypothetical protein